MEHVPVHEAANLFPALDGAEFEALKRDIAERKILADFDFDVFGVPTVSERRGIFYILDGQHRIEALRRWDGDTWPELRIECRVYRGLSEQEEAHKFRRLNDAKSVGVFDKFRTGVNAGYEVETKVQKVVDAQGLKISREKLPGAIAAVGTLQRVYRRSDGRTLGKTLRIVRDAFGDAGFDSMVIDGIGHLVQRYDGLVEEDSASKLLSVMHGGVKGLLQRATTLQNQTGALRAHCVAAAAVDVINSKRLGKAKLPSWWKIQKQKDGEVAQ